MGLAVEKENVPLAKCKQKRLCAHQSNSWYIKFYPKLETGSSKCRQAVVLSA